jgi:hypothetical protein
MIKFQKSADRSYVRRGSQETWQTFDPGNTADPFHRGFRALGLLNEVRLPPGTKFTVPSEGNQESVTYVREGSLVVRQRPRKEEYLRPGTYQRAKSHRLITARVSADSPSEGAHLFVISLTVRGDEGEPTSERRLYPFADRRGNLRLIASPDGGGASLRLMEDVRIYSSVLDPGHHVIHELSPGRGAWLHVVAGRVRLIDQSLEAGDGASLAEELAVSFTAEEISEILLFDLA